MRVMALLHLKHALLDVKRRRLHQEAGAKNTIGVGATLARQLEFVPNHAWNMSMLISPSTLSQILTFVKNQYVIRNGIMMNSIVMWSSSLTRKRVMLGLRSLEKCMAFQLVFQVAALHKHQAVVHSWSMSSWLLLGSYCGREWS